MSFSIFAPFRAVISPTITLRAANLRVPARDMSKWSPKSSLIDTVRKRLKMESTTPPSKPGRDFRSKFETPSKGKEKAKEMGLDEAENSQEKPSLTQYQAYRRHRDEIKRLYPSGWNPPRKLSREAMDGVRMLNGHDPQTFDTPALAERFRISPEAVRRILKSKWMPTKEEQSKLLVKERKRRAEAISRRIEKEREEQWEKVEKRLQEEAEEKSRKNDKLTFT